MTQATKQKQRRRVKAKRVQLKVKRYHPKVMENLMKQAYAEDHRREQMAELERSAFLHLSDFLEAGRG